MICCIVSSLLSWGCKMNYTTAVKKKSLFAKTQFLFALISVKRVGVLQSLSVSRVCMLWHLYSTGVTLTKSIFSAKESASLTCKPTKEAASNPVGSSKGVDAKAALHGSYCDADKRQFSCRYISVNYIVL